MRNRPFFALLAVATLLAPVAACQCSGGADRSGAQASGSSSGGAAEAMLAETSFKLPNGLAVDLVSGPCGDTAGLVVLLAVGIDHDPPGRSGMARLAGRVLASTAAAGRAERTVETGNDFTLYSVVAAPDRIGDELDAVAAWLAQAGPSEADLGRERARMLEELGKLTGADAALTAASLAEEAVQPTRGGGKRNGIASELAAITLAELQAFWQAQIKAGNARIVVAGRFEADKLRPRIEAAFTPLAAGTPPLSREDAGSTVKGTLVMGEAPTAVAIAVPAPAASDPLYAPFLILAARLTDTSPPAHAWEASYDPIRRPGLLFIRGAVGPADQPEPAAARIRSEAAAILARPPAAEDVAAAKERFRLFLDPRLVEPGLCVKDARAFAIARARRAQRGLDVGPLTSALEATTKGQLDEAAKLFETKRTAAVIAGGAIR